LKALAGDRDFVFPSQINSKKHMSNNTILKALECMGYKGRMTGHGFLALDGEASVVSVNTDLRKRIASHLGIQRTHYRPSAALAHLWR